MYVTTDVFLHGKTSQIFRVNSEERVNYSDVATVTPETADSYVSATFSIQDEAMDVAM